jgi:hypothetical protein
LITLTTVVVLGSVGCDQEVCAQPNQRASHAA